MKLFLHIGISDNQFNFNIPILNQVRSDLPGVYITDLDNFSNSDVILTAIEAIRQSSHLLIMIKMEGDFPLNRLLKIFQSLLKYHGKLKIIFSGDHEVVSKLMKPLKVEVVKPASDNELWHEIVNFFSNSSH